MPCEGTASRKRSSASASASAGFGRDKRCAVFASVVRTTRWSTVRRRCWAGVSVQSVQYGTVHPMPYCTVCLLAGPRLVYPPSQAASYAVRLSTACGTDSYPRLGGILRDALPLLQARLSRARCRGASERGVGDTIKSRRTGSASPSPCGDRWGVQGVCALTVHSSTCTGRRPSLYMPHSGHLAAKGGVRES